MFNNYFKSSCIAATFCLLFNNQLFTQQNLVPNPSFEQYTNCPNRNIPRKQNKPDIWYKPDRGGGGILILVQIMVIQFIVYHIIMAYMVVINMQKLQMGIFLCFIKMVQVIIIFK